jgi:hypothetical protein
VALFRDLQSDASLAEVLITLGKIARARGDVAAASAALTEALQLALDLGPRLMVAAALEGLACVVAAEGQAELAVRLLAPASVLRTQMGTPLWPADQWIVERRWRPPSRPWEAMPSRPSGPQRRRRHLNNPSLLSVPR